MTASQREHSASGLLAVCRQQRGHLFPEAGRTLAFMLSAPET